MHHTRRAAGPEADGPWTGSWQPPPLPAHHPDLLAAAAAAFPTRHFCQSPHSPLNTEREIRERQGTIDDEMTGASAYEEQRRRIMEANQRKMDELRLHHLSAAVKDAIPKPSPVRSPSSFPRRLDSVRFVLPDSPRFRSVRLAGQVREAQEAGAAPGRRRCAGGGPPVRPQRQQPGQTKLPLRGPTSTSSPHR
jgi:hypothetical protein